MSRPSQMCPHCLLTKININMVSEVKIWTRRGQSPAQEKHQLPFQKKVSLNSNTLMLIPTSWCKFQHVDATFQQVYATFQQVDAILSLHSNIWCTFQMLMPHSNNWCTFQLLILFSCHPNKLMPHTNCWCKFQPIPTFDAPSQCWCHFSLHPNNWCTFQLLMSFFYCCYATFQQVDAPSNCWYIFSLH